MPAAVDPALLLASLPFNAVAAFAVFARIGAAMMTAPAFGDFTLSPRIRLAVALAVTATLAPVVAPAYPRDLVSGDVAALARLLFTEIAIGVFLGLAARAMAAALNVAGQIIALQMGLSLAQIFDPNQQIQGAIIGGFLAILGTTMIFATDLHHVLLAAMRDSYFLFSPGAPIDVGAMAQTMTQTLSGAFSLGVRLAAPFIVYGLVFYVGAGVLNRLMPQAQVFFMLMPANLILGLVLLMMTTGLIMTAFLTRFDAHLAQFLR
ncbi:MAG: flagellar type III secretion system protein FliR [Parvularculaceae bacterium]|nr:flagellar type III secretion system protein FliR [Parvularculaceae bacterium]